MQQRLLNVQNVLELLRRDVKRAGSQSAWARRAGVDRTYVNKVLQGSRTPGAQILKALKLRAVVVCAGPAHLELLPILQRAVRQAGSISAWSRHAGIDRAVVSLVMHGKRIPAQHVFRALKQKRLTGYVYQGGKAED